MQLASEEIRFPVAGIAATPRVLTAIVRYRGVADLRPMTTLYTKRLRLEPFAERHLDGLHAMNSRPEVMRYLGGHPETREETADAVARVQRCWAAWGTSWWALLEATSGRVAGAGCIQYLRREAEPPEDLDSLRSNPMEIGWRLHPDFWHQGFATEAAEAMTVFAFGRFPISELLAVRHPENVDSGRVMDRLGMRFRGLEHWYGMSVAVHALSRDDACLHGRISSNVRQHNRQQHE